MTCKKSTQIAVNGALSLPNHAPDIDFLLRVTSTPIIKKTIILDKQISFSGHVNIYIEFVSSNFNSTQTVHFISFETPFIALINHCCAKTGMDCQLKAFIKHQDFQLINNRCINKLIVLKIRVIKLSKSCINLNSHCSEPSQALLCTPEKFNFCRTADYHTTHPLVPTDDLHEMSPFSNFHTPSSQQLDPSNPTNNSNEHDSQSSYQTCEYHVDPE
ncbi:SPOCS domain-containing protein [Pelosinus propionicus]|uniref:SipL SPOCS domain-containing protein n=1 Tax=Pelosinus propionicus DSM 13327 TaxID=1123291 RepID=A0A1I4PUH2_9FIRM|nr:SPOCS domain-containing protein [Pelosinus propionicus]SFM31459.1 protein of unknown function [Pelosinus propionicus DSM 13327]